MLMYSVHLIDHNFPFNWLETRFSLVSHGLDELTTHNGSPNLWMNLLRMPWRVLRVQWGNANVESP